MPLYDHITVTLFRETLSRPWGFRIQGGVDVNYALTIQRVFSGSPADEHLLRGDIIEMIDRYNVTQMTHKQVQSILKISGLRLDLNIKRPFVNAPNYSHNAQLRNEILESQTRQYKPSATQNYYSQSQPHDERFSANNDFIYDRPDEDCKYQSGAPMIHNGFTTHVDRSPSRSPVRYTSVSQPVSPLGYEDEHMSKARSYTTSSRRQAPEKSAFQATNNNSISSQQDTQDEEYNSAPVSERCKIFDQPDYCSQSYSLPHRSGGQSKMRSFYLQNQAQQFHNGTSVFNINPPLVFGWSPSPEKLAEARRIYSYERATTNSSRSQTTNQQQNMSRSAANGSFNNHVQATPRHQIKRCTSTTGFEQITPSNVPQDFTSLHYHQRSEPLSGAGQTMQLPATQRQLFKSTTTIHVEPKSSSAMLIGNKPKQVLRRYSFSHENTQNERDQEFQTVPLNISTSNKSATSYSNYRPAFPASYDKATNYNPDKSPNLESWNRLQNMPQYSMIQSTELKRPTPQYRDRNQYHNQRVSNKIQPKVIVQRDRAQQKVAINRHETTAFPWDDVDAGVSEF